ncbi:leucine-rich repeat and fibronectin type-III domain-containing protein 2 [Scomber scombrus]|uniref:Leucine-rich repeat and fibronectin type-III domain-containing protein 2 n=1 Tax=Scomber scombrus TaxID=13677 RepID=A0AAV1PS00_SCOSC
MPQSQPQPQLEPKVKAKVTLQDEVVEFKCGSLQSSLTSSSSSSGSMAGGSYSPNSTLANIWRSAPSKPRSNLDHLLGAFSSLELRGAQGRDAGASSSASTTVAKPHTDREPLLGRTLDSSLSRLLMLPLDNKPRRSQSFDMGDVTTGAGAAQLCNKPRRISSIWTKRSLSVNGMLLQCEEEGDTGGSKGTIDSTSNDWVMESTV